MARIAFNLHPKQAEVHAHPARFKVVVAGRRFGKTIYAIIRCFEEALATQNAFGVELDSTSEVIYIAIDREQAKRNAWPYVKQFVAEIEKATGLECRVLEKISMVELPPELGGCRIRLLGMDDPDAARGMKLRFAVLDEYADMPSRVWGEIIRPALADVRGSAIFIGTPKGRNHFYHLVKRATEEVKLAEEEGRVPQWAAFNYATEDNPFIQRDELQDLIKEYTNGSEDLYEQEIAAKFISQSGQLFSRSDFHVIEKMPDYVRGQTFMACDLAGFEPDPDRKSQIRRLDDHALAVVTVSDSGDWYVREIQYGKWGTRETALKIMRLAQRYKLFTVGIEKGIAKTAVEDYLADYVAQMGRSLSVIPLTHGNQRKFDRIQWALQGRAQKGQIYLINGPWVEEFLDQAISFPDTKVHDDLVDALSYIDQMAPETMIGDDWAERIHETETPPMDNIAGY